MILFSSFISLEKWNWSLLHEIYNTYIYIYIKSVQFSHSAVSDSLRPHGLQHTRLPSPSISSRRLLKLVSIKSVMTSNHLILCHPLLLSSIFPSIRVFSNESVLCVRWPKYWSFSFNISLFSQNWFPWGWTDWISLQSKGLSKVSSTTAQKHQF